MACTLYNYADEGCSGNVLTGSLAPSMDHLASWIDHAADTPRHISMTSSKNDPHVQALFNAMKSNVGADNVRTLNAKRDTREPEFIIYDSPQTVLTGKHLTIYLLNFFGGEINFLHGKKCNFRKMHWLLNSTFFERFRDRIYKKNIDCKDFEAIVQTTPHFKLLLFPKF